MSRGKVELTIEEYDQLMELKNSTVSKEKYDELIEKNNLVSEKLKEECIDLRESFAYTYYYDIGRFNSYVIYYTKEDIMKLVEESDIDFKTNIANSTIFNLLKLRKQYKKEVK